MNQNHPVTSLHFIGQWPSFHIDSFCTAALLRCQVLACHPKYVNGALPLLLEGGVASSNHMLASVNENWSYNTDSIQHGLYVFRKSCFVSVLQHCFVKEIMTRLSLKCYLSSIFSIPSRQVALFYAQYLTSTEACRSPSIGISISKHHQRYRKMKA